MRLGVLIAMVGCVAWSNVLADSPAPHRPWMTTSKYGEYLFKMVPAQRELTDSGYVTVEEAKGVAYEIDSKGELKELWRAQGWYTFEGYLSENGRYFVRIGPWANDLKGHTDLAVAFYDRGELLKSYKVNKLIEDLETLEYSVSHYFWHASIQTEPNGIVGGQFHLVMIDKTLYRFDLATGEIVKKGRDAGAKSSREINAEEREAARKKGMELYEGTAIQKDFETRFEISSIEAMRGTFSSCSLEGPSWNAKLKPKNAYEAEVGVSVVLPIVDEERLEMSLSAEELVDAVVKALAHPFIRERLDHGGATGIRLRTLGDRLHWNTEELAEFLSHLRDEKVEGGIFPEWAYVIIDAKEPRYKSLYLNTESGEVIHDEGWPRVAVLVGVDGEEIKRAVVE